MIAIIGILIAIFVFLTLFLLTSKKTAQTKATVLKMIAISYFFVYFVSCFYRDFIGEIYALTSPSWSTLSKIQNLLLIMSRIMANITLAIYPLAAFFKFRHFRNVAFYIGIPAMIFFNATVSFSLIYLHGTMDYQLWDYRSLLMISQGILGIVFPLYLTVEGHFPAIRKGDAGILAVITFLLLILMFPIEGASNLIGTGSGFILDNFKVGLIWMIEVAFLGISLYIMLHDESYETKYAALIAMAIGTIVVFFRYFSLVGWSYSMLPFQICNLGTIFVLLCLITKNKAIFRFTYFANVVGTFIAIVIRDVSSDILSISSIHYTYAHAMVFLIPILSVALGIFPRQKLRDLLKTIPVFTAYFLFSLFLSTWFINYDSGVNYFFLTGDTIVDRFTFLFGIRSITYEIGIFKFYPLYQLIIYFGFLASMFVNYLCINYGFHLTESIRDLMRITKEERELKREMMVQQKQDEEAIDNA